MKSTIFVQTATGLALAAIPAIAHAEIPQPVRALIDAAIATGDAKQVKTVIALAKQTNPADIAELDAIREWQAAG